jgi:hypothetical protein
VTVGNESLQLPVPVQAANPCLPGTLYGSLPLRHARSRTSTSGAFANLTDVMTIPASVARRAYLDAAGIAPAPPEEFLGLRRIAQGDPRALPQPPARRANPFAAGIANSAFFYVRRFTGGSGGDRYVVVTCRMAGGGARVPLSLVDVRLQFEVDGRPVTVLGVPRGDVLPRASVRLAYTGSGVLRGRWEVVAPGDAEPGSDDLLTEATLPVERRALQRRYTLVERFEHFLPPSGSAILPGPDPRRLPATVHGAYLVLFRVEASDDGEALSDTGGGRLAQAGGVAGFPMPVLRYHVGEAAEPDRLAELGGPASLQLLQPAPDAALPAGQAAGFAWVGLARAPLVRLEVEGAGQPVLSALLRPGTTRYEAPPWMTAERAGQQLRWRLVALDAEARPVVGSAWQAFSVR